MSQAIKQFGEKIRKIRKRKKMKYREVAAAMGGVSLSTVRFIEIGRIRRPSWKVVKGLRDAFQISEKKIEQVFFGS
jgi:transcriptional regulator with XRE-family HTH domain